MSPLSLVLNVLWIVFGGVWMALGWLVAGLLMIVTIIGIPWAASAFRIAGYAFLPFGRVAVRREDLGDDGVGTGPFGTVANILWLILAGWWLALGHLITAVGLAITVIGLPFAWAHLKLAALSLWPVGTAIVAADDAPRVR
jgi:uncharacterized membrane protein YccF (DUF307 family)